MTGMADLTNGAQLIVSAALAKRDEFKHSELGCNHWLIVLCERHGTMLESLLPELKANELSREIGDMLSNGKIGTPLDENKVCQRALEMAKKRGKMQGTERDLAIVVMEESGYAKMSENSPSSSTLTTEESTQKNQNSSMLERFGRDLTKAAAEGKILPVVGRAEEIQLVIETLCRRTKRNPVLVGPAGVGKTAIVEGLALKVREKSVPKILHDTRIISLQPSVLVAGADMRGEIEKRMQALIKEASQSNIILFIDEIHSVMGAGGMLGTTDIGSLLKPSLARGEIACIAATTDDEYRRFIETDTALERRFQPIRVNELSAEETYNILVSIRAELQKRQPIDIHDEVLQWLINFGVQYMRNRNFPDKAVDLLEQCFAHAIAQNSNSLTMDIAQEVAQRMVGMPIDLELRFQNLENALLENEILQPGDIHNFINRLQVTMRGLDIRPGRPNAVVLLNNDAKTIDDSLARVVAKFLFGSEDRVITIDLGRLWHPEDVSLLVGSPPGYIGYSDSLPIHKLGQIPWCVLLLENIDKCHPSIRDLIAQSITNGWITDGRGKKLFLSDSVVLLTADIDLESHHGLGFTTIREDSGSEEQNDKVAKILGDLLSDQINMVINGVVSEGRISIGWLKHQLLPDLTSRYRQQGLELEWDSSLAEWMVGQESKLSNTQDCEKWVDEVLGPAIIPHLPKEEGPVSIIVGIKDNHVWIKSKKPK